MQNRISYYILSLLHLNGSVKIPGLGKIEQKRLPAREQGDTDMLSPPQTGTSFAQSESPRGGLLERYIAYKTNLSRTKVHKELVHYAQQVRDTARNEGRADLQYLGKISGTDPLSFEARQEFLNPGHAALHATPLPQHLRSDLIPEDTPESDSESLIPTFVSSWPEHDAGEHHSEDVDIPSETVARETQIETPPEQTVETPALIADIKEPATANAPIQQEPETKKKNARLWLLPVLAALLLAVCLAAFLFFTRDNASVAPPELVGTQDGVTEIIPDVDEPDPVELDLTTSPEEATPDDLYTETPSESDSQEISATPLESDATGTSEVAGNPIESTAGSNATENLECMVVVGAFSLTTNADRMSQLLRSLGYEVRSIQRGKLAQIGVPVDCNAGDNDDITATLRNTVEASAWLLRPQ